jgi:hypothetical protein
MKKVRGEREEIQVVKVGQVADALRDGLQLVVVEGPVGKGRAKESEKERNEMKKKDTAE